MSNQVNFLTKEIGKNDNKLAQVILFVLLR